MARQLVVIIAPHYGAQPININNLPVTTILMGGRGQIRLPRWTTMPPAQYSAKIKAKYDLTFTMGILYYGYM